MRARASAPSDAGVTVTDLLVVALARALAEVPELNALRRADGSVERSRGRAPLDRRRDPVRRRRPSPARRGVADARRVAQERRRLVEAARQGALDGRDLAGGTCTLSNLGAHPVDFFAPVVSGPQVAMVATGRVADRPVADGRAGRRPADDVGERRHRPPRRRRRGGRTPACGFRTSDRTAPRRLAHDHRPCSPSTRPSRALARSGADDDSLLALYREMVRVRAFEEEVIDAFGKGLIPGSTHPCIGAEAIKAGALSALRPDDLVFATYRGHGEALIKGVDPVSMMAELMGARHRRLQGQGRLDAPLRAVGRAGLDERDRRGPHPDGRRCRARPAGSGGRGRSCSASSATGPRARASSSRR